MFVAASCVVFCGVGVGMLLSTFLSVCTSTVVHCYYIIGFDGIQKEIDLTVYFFLKLRIEIENSGLMNERNHGLRSKRWKCKAFDVLNSVLYESNTEQIRKL